MKFIYTAKSKRGVRRSGELEADDREAALRELKARGLTVVALTKASSPKAFYFWPITVLDRVLLTKHLSIMLKAGVVLNEALRIAELQAKGKMRGVVGEVRVAVEGGARLGDAMAAHPEIFGNYYVNMVKAGEESGNLAANLDQLSARLAKDYELKQKAQTAMLYPALVVSLTVGLGVLIAVYVLPRLSSLFKAFDFELPLTTRILIAVSEFLGRYGTWVAVGLITGLVLALVLARATFTRPFTHWFVIRLPVLRGVVVPLNLARLTMVLASLLKSGIPIEVAIGITEQVLGNVYYQDILRQAAERVDHGETLSASLGGFEPMIPVFVARMIQIGDETGKTEDILFYLAEFYENELDNTLKNLSTLIEPVMLVAIGLVVLVVALSIITPIYNFIGAIG